MLKANVGTTDRLIRLIPSLVVGAAGIAYSGWRGLIGLVLVATVTLRW